MFILQLIFEPQYLSSAGTGSLLDDVADAEADYEQPDELMDWDGVPLEPFNLKAERERGYFDAEGNYLEFSNPEDNDAWLASLAGMFSLLH